MRRALVLSIVGTALALAGLVHLSWLGPQGLREVGQTCMSLAAYAQERLGLPLAFPDRPTFKEFAVRLKRPARDVIADMFGMALRTYHRKVRAVSERAQAG